ncbi:hypothetical protein BGY98DRAFT_959557 [Russula aff. rugulosa BPL654]|nr:hypothetical protein BGY98DRAFT_959557 [Russula aff. rugulosa BPL654]
MSAQSLSRARRHHLCSVVLRQLLRTSLGSFLKSVGTDEGYPVLPTAHANKGCSFEGYTCFCEKRTVKHSSTQRAQGQDASTDFRLFGMPLTARHSHSLCLLGTGPAYPFWGPRLDSPKRYTS